MPTQGGKRHSRTPEIDIDTIEARARDVLNAEAEDDTMRLSDAIDRFDEHAIDDVLKLVAEVRKLRAKIALMETRIP